MTKPDIGLQPVPYTRLGVKYFLVALYGAAASIVGVTTINVVGGHVWETAWPFLLSLSSLAAIFGIIRSKYFQKTGFEFGTTLTFISLLMSYSVAIVVRTLFDGDMSRLPVAVLPVIISVTPFARILDIARGWKRK